MEIQRLDRPSETLSHDQDQQEPSDAVPDTTHATGDANLHAGLCYIPPLGALFFFREKHDPFVRFHAAQSLALALVAAALLAARWLVFGALDHIQSLGMVFFEIGLACVFGLVGVAFVGLWLWAMISGFAGRKTRLPLVGELAERMAGGPMPYAP